MDAPETAAKQALHAALVAAFASDDEVEVSYGPPPAGSMKTKQVWVGGVEADEDHATLRGPTGGGLDETFRVSVAIDATVPDPSPAGARAVSDIVYGMLATVRATVRQQVADGPYITVDGGTRTLLRWSRITAHSSDGPLPLEGGGWVETVVPLVQFSTRIRG